MKINPLPSQERLRELFDYSDAVYVLKEKEFIGGLVWRARRDSQGRPNTREVGRFAGTVRPGDGRVQVAVDGKLFELNRLVWAWHNGDSHKLVDHSSRDTSDNRIGNLREATFSQNNSNRTVNTESSSQFVGVYFDKDRRKWVAQIKKNRHVLYLGSFHTEAEAADARDEASKRLFGEFAVLNA